MDAFDEQMFQRAAAEPFPLPEDYTQRVLDTCAALKETAFPTSRSSHRFWGWAAAAVVLFAALPNLSAPVAHAMEQIPVLGAVVRVITFRSYTDETDRSHADVQVPQIEGTGSAVGQVNTEVQTYTDRLIAQFQTDRADLGESYEGLDVSYEVVTDSDTWFTLRIFTVETAASGYESSKIYHINKVTDQTVSLADLFRADADYRQVLSAEVLRQMKQQMETEPGVSYFIDEFTEIAADQNFYYDAQGNLVLVFDEYDVAPGSMGAPEFSMNRDVYASLLR